METAKSPRNDGAWASCYDQHRRHATAVRTGRLGLFQLARLAPPSSPCHVIARCQGRAPRHARAPRRRRFRRPHAKDRQGPGRWPKVEQGRQQGTRGFFCRTSNRLLIPSPQCFADPKHYLVHDPNSSLRTGDVVSIVPGWPTSQHKRHVVKHIIAPYGVPIDERPPVPTLEESIAEREAKKAVKDQRRAARRTSDHEKAGKGDRDAAKATREPSPSPENPPSEVD